MDPSALNMAMIALMIAGYLGGAVMALLTRGSASRSLAAAGSVVGGTSGIVAAFQVMLSQGKFDLVIPSAEPLVRISFCLDPLGAFFLLLIGIVTIPAAVYGIGYTNRGPAGPAPRFLGCMLNLFFISMSLVVMASNVLTFLLFWEAMSFASYFLVISEHQDSETLSAGTWYAGMAHAGFLFITLALLISAAETHGMQFSEIRIAGLSPALKNLIFGLALLGFGSKAGLIPIHVWLPKAHPAAPSHISAMMSGVMVKLGIYGIVRMTIDLLGGGPSWWGGLVLALGAVSALLGVLYALMEHDLKRLLAYHTVENVGLISMGVGLAMIFRSYDLAALAAFALVAGLFHALNHGAFKGLLFLGAGAVLRATGTRNMEELGGLIRRMPVTSACFLVGAAAISGLPPLNGFASEWMLFQSLLSGVRIPHSFVAAMMAISVGILALTAGLAAACFVKAFGISFLALPRSQEAERAREVSHSMRFGMVFLAVSCIVIGVLPSWVASFLARAIAGLPGMDASAVTFRLGPLMAAPDQASRIFPTYLALVLIGVIAIIPLIFRLLRVNRSLRLGETWGCGRVGQTARMEYTSMAFAEPLRRVFAALYRPTKDLTIDFHPESKYFVQSIQYRSRVQTWFDEFLYEPAVRGVKQFGASGRWIQSGSVHRYISYIFLALLALLLLARWL
jgi:hydrogenase-4 component B